MGGGKKKEERWEYVIGYWNRCGAYCLICWPSSESRQLSEKEDKGKIVMRDENPNGEGGYLAGNVHFLMRALELSTTRHSFEKP